MAGKRKYNPKRGSHHFTQKRTKTRDFAFAGAGAINKKQLNEQTGNNVIVKSVRSVTLASGVNATGTPVYGAYSFKLSDLPNYTQYTALYDEYRMVAVRVDFIPTQSTGVPGTASVPALYTWIDTDDATTPSSLTSGQCFQTYKAHGLLNTMRTRKLIPEVAAALYTTSFAGYGQMKNQWIDCNSPGVTHYALKYAVINGTSNDEYFDVHASYYLEFRKTV